MLKSPLKTFERKCSLFFLFTENSSPAISQEPNASFLCVGWHLTVVSVQWLVIVSNSVVTAPSSTFIISLCGFSGAADTLGLKFGKMYKQSGYIWIRVESEFWAPYSQILKWLCVDITYISFFFEYLLSTFPWGLKQHLGPVGCSN